MHWRRRLCSLRQIGHPDFPPCRCRVLFRFILLQHFTGLQEAAECGHTEVVKRLLEAGADVNACEWVSEMLVG